ncbi:MAG: glycoside hydrolase family 15 protein [Rhodospirillales bacterium]|nr:glycoside hydrolase family 15 protein [Rhodospirillales bacterium]
MNPANRDAEHASLDLAVIGNCVTAALIDRQGRIDWWCHPRFDGDPLFCALIDPPGENGGGFMDALPEHPAGASQRYLPNSACLETILADRAGNRMRLLDFSPRFKQHGRIFRPAMLIRRIEPLEGRPRIRLRIRPRFDHGRTVPRRVLGSNHLRFLGSEDILRVTTDAPISYIAEEQYFILDRPLTLILGPDETVQAEVSRTGANFLARTHEYWNEWVRNLSIPFEWQDAVIRAAITLKLCSFEETGGIVAALTTSIPEAAGTARNWDYRYCWLRDAYFVVHALNRLGATQTMESFIRYITNVAALDPGGRLRPVYAIIPGQSLAEREEPGFAGYRGHAPVRIGNAAAQQVQNDSYGSVVLAAAQMFFDRRLPHLDDEALFASLEAIGARAAEAALQPDASLWEFRGRLEVHTFSSVMCWAACDRLMRIARVLGRPERAAFWQAEAEHIRAIVLERGWNAALGSFTSSFGGAEVDASLLLLRELGFVSAADPRFLGTLALIEARLRRGDHLLRYDTADDFGSPENAFVICTFWYIDALGAVGRTQEARRIFENLLAMRNHLGLLSEDIDPASGALWGNFPQTYSMVGLIISATRLSQSWEEAFWRGS